MYSRPLAYNLVLHVEVEVHQMVPPLLDSLRGVIGVDQSPESLITQNGQQLLEMCRTEQSGVHSRIYKFCNGTCEQD